MVEDAGPQLRSGVGVELEAGFKTSLRGDRALAPRPTGN